jgi:hypothetical protein
VGERVSSPGGPCDTRSGSRQGGRACRGPILGVRWAARVLAVLEGDVELVPLKPNRCRVTLCVSYAAPFGGPGHQLDRALLHRVAGSSVGSFLARVARSLEDENLG